MLKKNKYLLVHFSLQYVTFLTMKCKKSTALDNKYYLNFFQNNFDQIVQNSNQCLFTCLSKRGIYVNVLTEVVTHQKIYLWHKTSFILGPYPITTPKINQAK